MSTGAGIAGQREGLVYIPRHWIGKGEDLLDSLAICARDIAANYGRELGEVGLVGPKDGGRPMLLLHPGSDHAPTVWLLGWRGEGDVTSIHDHGRSAAGIHVLRGDVVETIYHTPQDYLDLAQHGGFPLLSQERRSHKGSTLSVEAPYIHAMGGTPKGGAITIHAYYPPLVEMDYFKVEDGQAGKVLTWQGKWGEEDPFPGEERG